MQAIFNSFVRLTKEELWDSEEELRAYVYADNNYEKLLKGEIGINLIQTHTAMSLAVMDDWVKYVFQTANAHARRRHPTMKPRCRQSLPISRPSAQGACTIFGEATAMRINPCVLLRYDVASWMRSPLSTPLSEYKFTQPGIDISLAFPRPRRRRWLRRSSVTAPRPRESGGSWRKWVATGSGANLRLSEPLLSAPSATGASDVPRSISVNRRKICVVTTSRAEFGLLRGLLQSHPGRSALRLQVIASGHASGSRSSG